jgi:hypothetical protein
MPSEIVLFHLDGVIVTTRRFTVGQRSFSVGSISALQIVEKSRPWLLAALGACLAALVGSAAITTSSLGAGIVAIGLFLIAIACYLLARPRCSLVLDTDDGRFTPLTSSDRFLVTGVASVLQSAATRLAPSAETATRDSNCVPTRGFESWAFRTRKNRPGVDVGAAVPILHSIHAVSRRTFHPGKTA